MIHATGIYKSYGTLPVLKGVNIDIDAGSIVAVMGKSGAGKSTLLQILGTLDQADKGDIYLDGKAIHQMNANEIASFRNLNIGFVFQFHHLLPEFTAIENVLMPAWIAGKDKNSAKKKAEELLEYLGLQNRMTHKPNELSGGEQQRVAIARALINQPKVVFADEPTGNLDTQSSQDFHQLIHQLRQDFNQTFLIVTHNPDLAAVSDRIILMEDGIMVAGNQQS